MIDALQVAGCYLRICIIATSRESDPLRAGESKCFGERCPRGIAP